MRLGAWPDHLLLQLCFITRRDLHQRWSFLSFFLFAPRRDEEDGKTETERDICRDLNWDALEASQVR
jgi:hypothetical protein